MILYALLAKSRPDRLLSDPKGVSWRAEETENFLLAFGVQLSGGVRSFALHGTRHTYIELQPHQTTQPVPKRRLTVVSANSDGLYRPFCI